jgi:Ubiquitin-binding domain
LKNVSELLREGELATARGILEAAGVTTPTGNLMEGCYDEAGNLYRLPETIILDPTNVISDETTRQHNRNSNMDGETMVGLSEAKSVALDSGQTENIGKEEEDSEAIERRREEKGKASERDAVKVKCRLSDRGGPDVVIVLGRSQTVGALARRVQSETDVSHFCLGAPRVDVDSNL